MSSTKAVPSRAEALRDNNFIWQQRKTWAPHIPENRTKPYVPEYRFSY